MTADDFVELCKLREVGRWDFKNRIYDKYVVPVGAITYCEDFEAQCQCAECSKMMVCGEGYTSIRIHTRGNGIGFIVCSDCYDKEWKERREYDCD